MSVRVSRRSSSSSLSSMNSMSLTRTRVASRGPSAQVAVMDWGAGGGRSLSRSISTSSLFTEGNVNSWMAAVSGETSVVGDEKLTMQNLNDRLASYLEKVRSLESSNLKLEMQIRQFYEKRAPLVSKDRTDYFATISDLRSQISQKFIDNQRIILNIDNALLASNDFKQKYETEMVMTQSLMSDLLHLRGVRDSLTLTVTDLEGQHESLKEELVYMKKDHQQEIEAMTIQSGDVTVDMELVESSNLQTVLDELREEYEALVVKNSKKIEEWFQSQVATLQTEITTRTTEVNTFTTQLSELKRNYKSLEITSQGIHKEIECLQQSLEDINRRYGLDLSQRQVIISTLEAEIQQLRASIEQQESDYKLLLNIKMRLEVEIAEYRRLLEGEDYQKNRFLIVEEKVEKKMEKKMEMKVEKKVEMKMEEIVEEHKPHIEKRVRTIVEELVDGQVVAVSTDTKVESIQ